LAKSSPAASVGRLGRLGLWLFLGLLFLLVGLEAALTPYGAGAAHALGASSQLLGWCYRLWGVRGAGAILGFLQVLTGLGLLSGLFRPTDWPARLGAAGAAVASAIGASLLFTAPGVVAGHTALQVPLIAYPTGLLLAMHPTLLAASLMLLGESLGGGRR